jgi:hypothetical protein
MVSPHGCTFDLLTKKALGVWYRTTGTGERFTASSCGFATFDTIIVVFSKTCDSIANDAGSCIAGDDDSCDDFVGSSTVSWDTVANQNYYILVRGFSPSDLGDFELELSAAPIPPAPENDQCAGAITIEPDSTTAGTNAGAVAVDTSLTECTDDNSKSQPLEPFPPARSHLTDVFSTC